MITLPTAIWAHVAFEVAAGLCGLCSAVFLVSLLASDPRGVGGAWILVAVFGGVPIALGVGLFVWSRSLWRGAKQPPATPRSSASADGL
jgi:hypothetical protein